MRPWLSALSVIVAWTAEVARACPSCASPLEENRQAFVDTTILLTVLPLTMIGGFVWWLRRRVQEQQAEAAPRIEVVEALLRDGGPFSRDS